MTGNQSPLPQSIRTLIKDLKTGHPGLHLDKFAESWSEQGVSGGKPSEAVQKPTIDQVAQASSRPPAGFDFAKTVARRELVWRQAGARIIQAKTTSAITLHLSRASALENAGICLHPLYGFVYLPGTGVKGLARAYAETVWLPSQLGETWQSATTTQWDDALDQIDAVFGYAPYIPLRPETLEISTAFVAELDAQRQRRHDERKKFAKEKSDEDTTCQDSPTKCMTSVSGQVVFHDAWPATWPELQTDILNNHHSAYYGSSGNNQPPGDWENPIPVYFLSAKPGVEFQFAISPRRRGESSAELELAEQWLRGGLQHLGAGAKTNSGYGCFRLTGNAGALPDKSPLSSSQKISLTLATPAFLAGANQTNPADCTLRPATLRGQLRWWWRTLYSGSISVEELRSLEALVWGDTKQAGAIRLLVTPVGSIEVAAFHREDLIALNGIPRPPDRKTTYGLTYFTYGMNDAGTTSNCDSAPRNFVIPQARWEVEFRVNWRRASKALPQQVISAKLLLEQAEAALWLICQFGGVGAKSGKGLGSFIVPSELSDWSLERCQSASRKLLEIVGFTTQRQSFPAAPAWETALRSPLIPTPWSNFWYALDRMAMAAQSFAKSLKHQREKQALGLPRRIGAPAQGRFLPGTLVRECDRHASPLKYHLQQMPDKTWAVQLLAFPSAQLPNFADSQAFLQQAMDVIQKELQSLAGRDRAPNRPVQYRTNRRSAAPPSVPTQPDFPKAKDRVRAILLAEKTNKGGWKARLQSHDLSGPIVNTTDVPATAQPGQVVELQVNSCTARAVAFRWPTSN